MLIIIPTRPSTKPIVDLNWSFAFDPVTIAMIPRTIPPIGIQQSTMDRIPSIKEGTCSGFSAPYAG